MKRERAHVDESTELGSLCTGRFEKLAPCFTLTDGQLMIVGDLDGYTEERLGVLVEKKSGPWELVSPWLKKNGLRRFLDGYVSPSVSKKTKSHRLSEASPPKPLAPSSSSSSPSSPPEMTVFDISALLAPHNVPAPAVQISEKQPQFLTQQWLDERVSEICVQFQNEDDILGADRKVPMALVRCSRGGKTRALWEIARALSLKLPGVAVIRISFNDATTLKPWEQADPVGALCRRIAFAAQKNGAGISFKSFSENVSINDILTWLGDTACVLLIDELNQLKALMDKSHSGHSGVGAFLKENFLQPKNRYFVFTSHTVSIKSALSDYMDSKSERGVLVRQLPLIPSVSVAAGALRWDTLNPRQALFYGLVPSLIFLHKELRSDKRDLAIDKCFGENLVTEESVVRLLRSFFTGNSNLVPEPLLELMNTVENGKVHWIPCHMMEVLNEFASRGSLPNQQLVLEQIVTEFRGFCDAKCQSGDAWEHLFVVAMLMRALTRQFDANIFPLNLVNFADCSVTFNGPFSLKGKSFESYSTVDDFVASIVAPSHFPHVSVYFPTHASFEEVDVIVAAWRDVNSRELYGYQLREGKQLPSKSSNNAFLGSWVIRGRAAQSADVIRKWHTASEDDIAAFFGESGAAWTPAAWAKLSSSQ